MRLLKIRVPEGAASEVMRTAFAAGIDSVSVQQADRQWVSGKQEAKDVIDIETSTPKAKQFVEDLLGAEYYDPETVSLTVRAGRSIVGTENVAEVTIPLEVPVTDLCEELWEFSHMTYGLAGRVAIASGLLAYGLIEGKLLLMIAGLLFLPLLPVLMAISFGLVGGQGKLTLQGLRTLAICLGILLLGGAVVALLADPPMRYDDFNPFLTSLLISTAVGAAAGLAAIDDAGRRELIGLAAAAQIGIYPVWIGVALVYGPPVSSGEHELLNHAVSLLANLAGIIAATAVIEIITGVASGARRIGRAA